MNKRFLNVLKWILICFGILFIAQIILLFSLIIIANSLTNINLDKFNFSNKINDKDIQLIVNKAEEFKKINNKYPKEIKDIKLKKNLEYKYSSYDNDDCFKIELKNTKNNNNKQYQRCSINKDNLNSFQENFIEEN